MLMFSCVGGFVWIEWNVLGVAILISIPCCTEPEAAAVERPAFTLQPWLGFLTWAVQQQVPSPIPRVCHLACWLLTYCCLTAWSAGLLTACLVCCRTQ